MLFHSYIFVLLFLPVSITGYYLWNHIKKYQMGLLSLVVVSMWFIGYLNIWYLPTLFLSMAVNFLLTFRMQKESIERKRKIWLWIGVGFQLIYLAVFKYHNFLVETFHHVWKKDLELLSVFLPLGISFYTFRQIAYLIDCYRDKTIRDTFLDYSVYITFFPQFIQGPITLRDEFMPQLREESRKRFSPDAFAKGIYGFSLGMGKKVLLADNLAKIAAAGYGNIDQLNTPSAILTILAYSLQIYFDFSGYCDMAQGIGKIFQIELPDNFHSPYRAVSVADFWDRWHITLTRFFTRYVYIPLGGSRKGTIQTYINTMIVFCLSGLWHGAAWNFVLWGVLHGMAMILNRLLAALRISFPKVVNWLFTFSFINIAWIFFRAPSIPEACRLIGRIIYGGYGRIADFLYEPFEHAVEISVLQRMIFGHIIGNTAEIFAISFVLFLCFLCLYFKSTQEKVKELRYSIGKLLITVGVLFYSVISFSGISEFLYSNF